MKPMVPPSIGKHPLLRDIVMLQELVVETIDPELPGQHLIWLIQVMEGRGLRSNDVMLRAHATTIARRRSDPAREGSWIYEREDCFAEPEPVRNAVVMGFDPESHRPGRLAPEQKDMMMGYQGSGLGRVLMSLVIRRAKERFPERAIARALLSSNDADTDEKRLRRNSYYGRHGFDCEFPKDPERRDGWVSARRVSQLVEYVNPQKVSFLPLDGLVRDFVRERAGRVAFEVEVASVRSSSQDYFNQCVQLLNKISLLKHSLGAVLLAWALREYFR